RAVGAPRYRRRCQEGAAAARALGILCAQQRFRLGRGRGLQPGAARGGLGREAHGLPVDAGARIHEPRLPGARRLRARERRAHPPPQGGAGDRAVRLHRRVDRPPAPVPGEPRGGLLAQRGVVAGDRGGSRLRHAHGRSVDARRHAGGSGGGREVPRGGTARLRDRKAGVRAGCRIFTVPMGRPFLPALAEALLAGNLPVSGGARPSPMALSDVTLLLPTRRATRALQRALLAASGAPALLMPRIRQIIGGMDDGTASLLTGADDFVTDEAGTLRPAISDVARELALARLIVAWSEAERGGRDTEGGMAAN